MLDKDQLEDMLEDSVHAGHDAVRDVVLSHLEAIEEIRRLKQRFVQLPNAVMQSTESNCFAGCVATLLEVPIADVPGCDANTDWNPARFNDWLANRGLAYVEFGLNGPVEVWAPSRPVPCIVVGTSHRNRDRLHATVGTLHGEQIIYDHDPHASGLFTTGDQLRLGFFIPMGRGTVFPPATQFIIRRKLLKRSKYIQIAKQADPSLPEDWCEWYEVTSAVKATRFNSAEEALEFAMHIGGNKPNWKLTLEAVLKRKDSPRRAEHRTPA